MDDYNNIIEELEKTKQILLNKMDYLTNDEDFKFTKLKQYITNSDIYKIYNSMKNKNNIDEELEQLETFTENMDNDIITTHSIEIKILLIIYENANYDFNDVFKELFKYDIIIDDRTNKINIPYENNPDDFFNILSFIQDTNSLKIQLLVDEIIHYIESKVDNIKYDDIEYDDIKKNLFKQLYNMKFDNNDIDNVINEIIKIKI